jgi:hypothetical protein
MTTLSMAEKRYNVEYLQVDSLWAFHPDEFPDALDPEDLKALLMYYPQDKDIENAFEYRKDLLGVNPTAEESGRKALYKLMRAFRMDIKGFYDEI